MPNASALMSCRTRQAMMLLIENALEQQREMWSLKSQFHETQWLNEYCVVKIAGPRMSGHTWAIADVAKQLADNDVGSSVIVNSRSDMDGHLRMLVEGPDATGKVHGSLRYVPLAELDKHASVTFVFVDNAVFLGAGRRSRIEAFVQRCIRTCIRTVLIYVE